VSKLDQRARAFLARQRVAHLATADRHGAPHVVPICFAVLSETLYIALDEKPKRADVHELRRVRNILDNPRVAVVADVYNEDWARLGFVLLHCSARLVDAGAEQAAALRELRLKYPQYRAMALEDRPIIAADIKRVTTWGDLGPDD
jgi:coenzyme F420-0:L-glutamate ligase/coenzyme F420-1:gamma-L-glutamate ligase